MRFTWMFVVLAVGCGKKTEHNAPAADKPTVSVTASTATPAAPAAPAAAGPLTVEKVMAVGQVFKAFEPWDQELAKVQAALGPPTRVKQDPLTKADAYEWAAMSGDDCALFSVGKMDGKLLHKEGEVAGNASPMLFKNDGKLAAQRNECLEAAKAAK